MYIFTALSMLITAALVGSDSPDAKISVRDDPKVLVVKVLQYVMQKGIFIDTSNQRETGRFPG